MMMMMMIMINIIIILIIIIIIINPSLFVSDVLWIENQLIN